jgi:inositol polyphosphate 5-phosphatase INPP5B/F
VLLLSFGVATVNVMVDVDNKAASSLNPFHQRLNFMLHTDMGKECSVSISAEYGTESISSSCHKLIQYLEPTCFANSLSNLIRLPLPVRSIRSENQLLDEEEAATPPKEIMRLIGWLMEDGVNMVCITTTNTNYVSCPVVERLIQTLERSGPC